jgi:mannose-1-phosphate guanylyltransferase
MLLAAGLGTRLRPLTDGLPKILVPVLGVAMLDRLVGHLGRQGVAAFAMNTHHLHEAVERHLAAARARGSWPPIRLYHEPRLLGTGGGVANALDFWGEAPLVVWNGDILAEVDLAALRTAFEAGRVEGGAGELSPVLALLVVQDRPGDSRLLVDGRGRLCGIDSLRRGDRRLLVAPTGGLRALAFHGISLLAPAFRPRLARPGAFDLIEALLEAVAAGGGVSTFEVGGAAAAPAYFGTTGSLAELRRLEADLLSRPALLARWAAPAA